MTAEEIDVYMAELARIGREQSKERRNRNRQQPSRRSSGARTRRPTRR